MKLTFQSWLFPNLSIVSIFFNSYYHFMFFLLITSMSYYFFPQEAYRKILRFFSKLLLSARDIPKLDVGERLHFIKDGLKSEFFLFLWAYLKTRTLFPMILNTSWQPVILGIVDSSRNCGFQNTFLKVGRRDS